MFCDMVGSTALSTSLDPEEQRDVVSRFQDCCARNHKIRRAQFLGDGVLAYFGYPTAHEDAAERAVHASAAQPQQRIVSLASGGSASKTRQ
jgi:class 3 adenylate cyclase